MESEELKTGVGCKV